MLNTVPKSKEAILAYPLVMLPRNWEPCEPRLLQMTGSPVKRWLPSQRKNTKSVLLPTRLKENPVQQKWGGQGWKEQGKEEEEDDERVDSSAVIFSCL